MSLSEDQLSFVIEQHFGKENLKKYLGIKETYCFLYKRDAFLNS
jgi:hypothetical protein